MNLLLLLSTLLPLLPSLTHATLKISDDLSYSTKCAQKNPGTNAAISSFCLKRNSHGAPIDTIMVPGPRSHSGVVAQGIRAKITGNCTPPQWVPRVYCQLQFHYICATGGPKKGLGSRRFGRNACQKWTLEEAYPGGRAVVNAFKEIAGRDAEEDEGEVSAVENHGDMSAVEDQEYISAVENLGKDSAET